MWDVGTPLKKLIVTIQFFKDSNNFALITIDTLIKFEMGFTQANLALHRFTK